MARRRARRERARKTGLTGRWKDIADVRLRPGRVVVCGHWFGTAFFAKWWEAKTGQKKGTGGFAMPIPCSRPLSGFDVDFAKMIVCCFDKYFWRLSPEDGRVCKKQINRKSNEGLSSSSC